MKRYHKERKEWAKVTEYAQEAYTLIPEAKKLFPIGRMEEQVLLLLAEAAEEQGDMKRAREIDVITKTFWTPKNLFSELVACYRRDALVFLAAGNVREAIDALRSVPLTYAGQFDLTGINLSKLSSLEPQMAACKVLADALVQTGVAANVHYAESIRADVEETEAILTGYWEGILDETRRDLGEQQAAAVAAAAAAAPAADEGGAATKKSKAAKRKQQKRRAQQQKKAAEQAEVAAAVAAGAAARGEDDAQRQGEDSLTAPERQGKEGQGKGKQWDQEDDEVDGSQDALAAAAAALEAMAVDGTKQQEVEEEEEEECSVCLNTIDSQDANNPAGPPLVCGHRYHAFCLHFWVDKCTSKCIEPTCPYCRAPLREMEG